MNKIINVILILLCFKSNAQKVTIDILSNSGHKSGLKYENLFFLPAAPLHFLEPDMDTVGVYFIATIKGSAKNDDMWVVYDKIVRKAEKMGANCFKVVRHTLKNSLKATSLTLNVYYADPLLITKNENLHEKNSVFIFGNISGTKAASFKIDDTLKKIDVGYYYKHVLNTDLKTKFTQTGAFGSNAFAKASDKPALFLPLGTLGNGARGSLPPSGLGIGVSSSFSFIDNNFGLLLLTILKPKQ